MKLQEAALILAQPISCTNSGQIIDVCSCPETSTLKRTQGGWKGKVRRAGDPRLHNAAFHHSYATCPVVLSRTATYTYKFKHSEGEGRCFSITIFLKFQQIYYVASTLFAKIKHFLRIRNTYEY